MEVVVAGHICLDVIPVLHGPAKIEPGRLLEIGPAELSDRRSRGEYRARRCTGSASRCGSWARSATICSAARCSRRCRRGIPSSPRAWSSARVRPPVTRSSSARPVWTAASCTAPAPTTPSPRTTSATTSWRPRACSISATRRSCGRCTRTGGASCGGCSRGRAMPARRSRWTCAARIPTATPAGWTGRACSKRPSRWSTSSSRASRSCSSCWTRPAYARLDGGAEATDVVDLTSLSRLGDRLLGMGTTVVAIKLGEQGLYVRTSGVAGAGAGLLRSPVAERGRLVRSRGRVAVLPGAARRRDDRRRRLHDRRLPRGAAARRRASAGGDQRDGGRRLERRSARRDQRHPAVARARRSAPRRVGPSSDPDPSR